MENDLYHFSGRQSDANSSIVMSDYECNKKMRNISVQTGEEFSPEFLRDCVSRRTPFTNDASHIPMSKPGHSDLSQGMAHAFDKESLGSAISICTPDYSPNAESSGKIKFLCSFGGRILPRPNDAKLRYVGGDTRIISVKKDLTYNELVRKTTVICGYPHTIKYQLPGEDLDALISVSSDEDLHHMIEEYHDLERISQRLRIFLVSCGDANYQYVVAVNGMSPRRSSSRESLESQWMNINPDGSPTAQQKKPTNAFGHLNNLMLAGPSSQVYSFPPEITSKSYVLSPPSSPTQFKDPKTSCVRTYENAACLYEHQISCPYIVDASGYETPPVMDSVNHICSHVASHVPGSPFPVPSSELKSPLMYGIDYTSERRCFPNAEKTGPPEDMFSFSPVSDFNAKCRATDLLSELALPANDERNFHLEHGTKITLQPFAVENSPAFDVSISSQRSADRRTAHAKYLISGNKDGTFQDPPNVHKDFIQWGESTLNWMENKEISFDQDMKLSATKNHYASNADFFEEKQNLPQITCQPNLIMSIHAPKSELRWIGAKCSSSSSLCSSVENQTEVWKELSGNYQIHPNEPDFHIRSQRVESGPNYDDPNAINGNTSFFGCDGLEPEVRKENSDPSNIINVVELPDNESCLSLDCRGHLMLPKRTINDGLGGVSDGSMKNFKNSIEELNINNSPEEPAEDEHTEEAESVSHASDDDDDDVDIDDKDESISDATVIAMEASIYGLQVIKYADLEELQELGSGTFGTVYHGKWRGTDVAIKRIKKSCFAGGSSEQERLTKDFWREAKILSTLHHPNIVAFYGVVPDGPGGTLATVSEYMANGSLRHVLTRKDRALDRRKKVIVALDASFGMEYLHLKNIVHFDLKCDNLLVNLGDSQRPVCKVTDFGLSRIKQNTLVSGGVRGTLPWMAPELLNGNSSRVSEKVDVFSFGIVMWEILTGEEPYVDMHCGTIIGGIVNNTLRPAIPERCDPEWRKLMEECWSHNPSARPSFTDITKRLQVMSTALQLKRFSRVKR